MSAKMVGRAWRGDDGDVYVEVDGLVVGNVAWDLDADHSLREDVRAVRAHLLDDGVDDGMWTGERELAAWMALRVRSLARRAASEGGELLLGEVLDRCRRREGREWLRERSSAIRAAVVEARRLVAEADAEALELESMLD